jgi:hypothetical protein
MRPEKMCVDAAVDTSSPALATHIRKQVADFKRIALIANIRIE